MPIDGVARLLAIDEIKRLKARFFLAVDDKDWAAYASLFTDDAYFDVADAFADAADDALATGLGHAASVIGGKAMATLVSGLLKGTETLHIGYMPVIDLVSADEARAVWPVEDWLWFAPGTVPASLHGFGRYHERYARTDDGWRIASLRYVRGRILPTDPSRKDAAA